MRIDCDFVACALAAAACNQRRPAAECTDRAHRRTAPNAARSGHRSNRAAQWRNVRLPDDRTPLEEPKGPIDPKSAEGGGPGRAALRRADRTGPLDRILERCWSSADAAKAFDRNWRDDSEVHLEIGKPGDMEGAAGSIYITVPVVFYGKTKAGGSFRRGAT